MTYKLLTLQGQSNSYSVFNVKVMCILITRSYKIMIVMQSQRSFEGYKTLLGQGHMKHHGSLSLLALFIFCYVIFYVNMFMYRLTVMIHFTLITI